VADFAYAFSKHRGKAGGRVADGNSANIASFVGTGLSEWITTSVTSMAETFRDAPNFVGSGLNKWRTVKVTNLFNTFEGAGLTDVDLGAWDVSKVTTMQSTFMNAAKFAGNGLDQWQTGSVTTLDKTFLGSGLTTVNLGTWDVTQVTTLMNTFRNTIAFEGNGLGKWAVAKVSTGEMGLPGMTQTFDNANGLTTCNKRKIADAWTAISTVFVATSYDTDWTNDKCVVRGVIVYGITDGGHYCL
jgi:surface protein